MVKAALSALLFVVVASAADPDLATLRVESNGGRFSYELVNNSPYRVTGFEVITEFPGSALSCGVKVKVNTVADLKVGPTCSVMVDSKTGKALTATSRLESVEFANGLKWVPARAEK